MEIQCPSGMCCRLRKIKGTELIALAEQADDLTPGGSFATVIGGCWEGLDDRGPYPEAVFPDGSAPMWARVLKGDLLYMLFRLRAASVRTPDTDPGPWGPGDPYVFTMRCGACTKPYEWEVRLSQLRVQRMSAAAREVFANPNAYFHAEVEGTKYAFRPMLPDQDGPAEKLRRQQKRRRATFVDRMAAQIVEIDGKRLDMRRRWAHVASLDLEPLQDLQRAMDAIDCGIDTEIQTRCGNCGWEQDAELPLGKALFAPRERRKEDADPESDDGKAEILPSTPGSSEPSSST